MSTEFFTSISLLIALTTFVIGYIERQKSNRRRRTFEFLQTIINVQGPIHEANLKFALWISSGEKIKDDKLEPDLDIIIIRLLDFYDLVSVHSISGTIDKELVIVQLGGRIRSAYNMLESYINARRITLSRPGLYKPLENFVKNHIKDREI